MSETSIVPFLDVNCCGPPEADPPEADPDVVT